jgi:hypothetical protein
MNGQGRGMSKPTEAFMEKTTSILAEHRVSFMECSWEDVNLPGAYVEKGSGDLFRIPREALLPGSSPIIAKQSRGASRLVLISKDPYVTTEQARMLAAEVNVSPNF